MHGMLEDAEDQYFSPSLLEKFKNLPTVKVLTPDTKLSRKSKLWVITGMDPSGGAGEMAIVHFLVCKFKMPANRHFDENGVASHDLKNAKLDKMNKTRHGYSIRFVIIAGAMQTFNMHEEVAPFVEKSYDSLFELFPQLLNADHIVAVEGNMRTAASIMRNAAVHTVKKKYRINIHDPFTDPEYKTIGLYTTRHNKQLYVDRIGHFINTNQLVFNAHLATINGVTAEKWRDKYCGALQSLKKRIVNGYPKIEGHLVDPVSATWIALAGWATEQTKMARFTYEQTASRFI